MPRHQRAYRADKLAAFTLVELLVASTIALIVMGAVASLFGIFSRASTNSQSIVDLSTRMRSTANRLRQDLAGLTAPLAPPLRPDSDAGYFELIEGPIQDGLATTGSGALIVQSGTAVWASGTTSLIGDIDDALLFTTRKADDPFVGRFGTAGSLISSNNAEVAWYCRPSAPAAQSITGLTLFTLHRRQMLILPYVGASPFMPLTPPAVGTLYLGGTPTTLAPNISTPPIAPNCISLAFSSNPTTSPGKWPVTMWQDLYSGFGSIDPALQIAFDLSVKRVTEDGSTISSPIPNGLLESNEDTNGNGLLDHFVVPNSLGDLTRRENRFWRHNSADPNLLTTATNRFLSGTGAPSFDGTSREGEDVVLANVIAFDVRVFDPEATARLNGTTVVYPNDQPYTTALPSAGFTGCFLDLGCSGTGATTVLSGAGTSRSQLQKVGVLGTATYDTWSTHFESNGIDDDGDGLVDEGNDGMDQPTVDLSVPPDGTLDPDGIPDDPAERETSPPYPAPLRGIEVRIRCIEPTTKEIRQITIRHAFQ